MVCESEINTRFARLPIVGSGTSHNKQFFKKKPLFIEPGIFRRLPVIPIVNQELFCTIDYFKITILRNAISERLQGNIANYYKKRVTQKKNAKYLRIKIEKII